MHLLRGNASRESSAPVGGLFYILMQLIVCAADYLSSEKLLANRSNVLSCSRVMKVLLGINNDTETYFGPAICSNLFPSFVLQSWAVVVQPAFHMPAFQLSV